MWKRKKNESMVIYEVKEADDDKEVLQIRARRGERKREKRVYWRRRRKVLTKECQGRVAGYFGRKISVKYLENNKLYWIEAKR